MYSRPYTIWTTGSGDTTIYRMSVGVASDCNGGEPRQFTLTGSEISGCSAPPKIILYEPRISRGYPGFSTTPRCMT